MHSIQRRGRISVSFGFNQNFCAADFCSASSNVYRLVITICNFCLSSLNVQWLVIMICNLCLTSSDVHRLVIMTCNICLTSSDVYRLVVMTSNFCLTFSNVHRLARWLVIFANLTFFSGLLKYSQVELQLYNSYCICFIFCLL